MTRQTNEIAVFLPCLVTSCKHFLYLIDLWWHWLTYVSYVYQLDSSDISVSKVEEGLKQHIAVLTYVIILNGFLACYHKKLKFIPVNKVHIDMYGIGEIVIFSNFNVITLFSIVNHHLFGGIAVTSSMLLNV